MFRPKVFFILFLNLSSSSLSRLYEDFKVFRSIIALTKWFYEIFVQLPAKKFEMGWYNNVYCVVSVSVSVCVCMCVCDECVCVCECVSVCTIGRYNGVGCPKLLPGRQLLGMARP